MKIGNLILFRKKRVELGEGSVTQFTIFEHKKFGGIWFYEWGNVGGDNEEGQVRYHSHAFNSVCFTIRGSYIQDVIDENGVRRETVKKLFRPRFLKRDYVHRIVKAEPKTTTCVIFGKWSKRWYEYFEDSKTWVEYNWGRKVTNKYKNSEFSLIRKLIKK